MKETREQILGRAFDRHISVSAGAGSGKTRVLVQRFIHILEQHPGIDLSSIVAITFTRKAAAEMMKRVMDAVEEKLHQAIDHERMLDVQMWSRIRQHLSSARISTIDSFCSQIVREYPIEAGVPHSLSPLPTSKAVTMRRQCIEDALIHALDENNPQSESVKKLFHAHHHATVTKALDHLLRKGEMSLLNLYHILQQNDDSIIDQAWSAIRNDIEKQIQMIFSAVNELPGFSNADFVDESTVLAWNSIIQQYNAGLLNQLNDTTFSFLRGFETITKQVVSHYVTQKKTPTAKFKKYSDIPLEEWISINIDRIENTVTICEILCKVADIGLKQGNSVLSAEKDALSHARLLVDIAMHASKLYETQKRNEGTLEFSDVQTIAMELLNHPEAGPNIRSNIRFLMIDEFQDTNAMQYELASGIVRSLKGEKTDEDVNLYIVGDPKQSIYGFRSADVRVFGLASSDIQKANVLNGTINRTDDLNEDEQLGKLSLSVSFRLLPGIIGFINDLFTSLMGEKSDGYEVGYEKMIAGRNVSDEELKSDQKGTVSFLLHTQTDDDESQNMLDEASLIASAIKDMVVNKSKQIWDIEHDEHGEKHHVLRDIRYKDCTILYERRTMVNLLMAALRAEGIPYFTTGNKGFYASPAIVDIRNYLTFLSNVNDDIALAGVLLSPFFSISDDDIYKARSENPHRSLWESVQDYVDQFPDTIPTLQNAVQLLKPFVQKAQTMSLPILIHTMLEASHWRNIVKTMEDGAQWLANADKLIGISREFEQRGFRHIHAFVHELELAAEFDDESEAPIINTEDAVNLMTIHASKGLEFPIVILYDTNAKERSTPPDVYESDRFGIGLPLIEHPRVSGAHETVQSLISLAISRERRAKHFAEKKRLLYVALTRAKDHLFISSSRKAGKPFSDRSMMQMIAQHSTAFTKAIDGDQSIAFHTTIPILEQQSETIVGIDIEIPIHVVTSLIEITDIDQTMKDGDEQRPELFEESKQEYKDEWYSSSQFLMLEQDSSEFRKKYVLGFPDSKSEHHAGFMNDEDHKDISASQYGVLVHRVLQYVNTWIEQDGTINEQSLASVIDQEIHETILFSKEQEAIRDSVLKLCRNIHQTPLIQNNVKGLHNAKTEYSLTIPIDDDFFVVVYDLMLIAANGKAEVWDWKTNACSQREEVDALVERYEMQMRFYAYMLHLMYPEQDIFTMRLLFTSMIKDSHNADDWMRELVWSKEDMPSIREEIQAKIKQAKRSTLL